MNGNLNQHEKKHVGRVKELPCSICGQAGPSDAHHIEQGLHHLCIPLCKDCHQGSFNGIHGQARIWKVKKLTELSVLNETYRQLVS